jgi:hypothetical protein
METILQGLMELSGVRAAMVLDGGQLVAHVGQAIYDRGLCQQVGSFLTKALESIQLQQEDWETAAAQYEDGKILVRRVSSRPDGPRHVVAIVADGTLNSSFATVALRVAANKVKSALQGGTSHLGSGPLPTSASQLGSGPLSPSGSQPPGSDSRPVLANTGISWSKTGSTSSSLGSNIQVADPGSQAFLVRCAAELARHVGPMSKVYVQEAVRRVCPDAPFSLAFARQIVDDLSGQVEDPKDRTAFRRAVLEKK